jgi:pyruvate ferredoxin oxidoreductase beta subunit/2-oxoisovalerate ferredoxin oxidoreductase beta subunit
MALEEIKDHMRPGHSACPGCGVAIAMRLVLRSLGDRAVIVVVPSCSAVISGVYPNSALKLPAFHSAFEIAAPTAAGIANALKLLGQEDRPVVAFAGDGGTFDIGLQSLSGAADRNENFIYVCLDNEAYMNTGIQASSATPTFAWTATTPSGRYGRKKRLMEIMAAHRIPYAATASIGYPRDLMEKVEKAKQIKGTKFIHVLAPCPTGWRMSEDVTVRAAILSVQTRVFPLYEIEDGKRYRLTQSPEVLPVSEYLNIQGRFRHMHEEEIERMQEEVAEEWEMLVHRIGTYA